MQPRTIAERVLRTILDSVSYAVVAMDHNGDVVCLNEPARQFLRQRRRDFETCVGKPAERILPLAAPLAMEAMSDPEFQAGRRRIVDKGKELFFEITPWLEDGEMRGAVVSLQRPERFEELASKLEVHQKLHKQLQAIFDSSSDGIWVTDGDGVIIDMNAASEKLNGVSAQDMMGRSVKYIVTEGLVDQSVTVEVMQHKRTISLIQNVPRTSKQLLVTGTPVFDRDGAISLVVVNERDITELNMLKAGLENARRDKRRVQDELDGLVMLELEKKEIVAESESMRRVLTAALKLAKLDAPTILVLGESGVGKGLLAKFIHKNSPRRDKPFMAINCAALPENLFEAELFGYERGAFTGAREEGRTGLLTLAETGTLFLDEIGELSQSVQAKLLKCLEDREFMPLGGASRQTMNCTVIAATNRDLDALVRKRQFRKDFYYRLNTFTLRIPPLRERADDLTALVRTFVQQLNNTYGTKRYITSRSMDLLQSHSFPGNVRELEGLLRQGVVMAEEDNMDSYIEQRLLALTGGGMEPGRPETLPAALDSVERAMLLKARAVCVTTREMAAMLGVSQPTIVRKLQKHRLS